MVDRRITTWRKEIENACKSNGETFDDIVSITLDAQGLDEEFCSGFGGSEGRHFTAWSTNYVYFPVTYDGAEWAGSVARNPNGLPTKHIGGE